jgi:hypothetical protein
MSAQNNKSTNAEYANAKTEAQALLKALTTTFTMFIDEHKEPDILGLKCVIDDTDRLAGTIRRIYQLAQNNKAVQQPEPIRPAQNQTEQSYDLGGFDPDYRHHDMCSDEQDVIGFFESLNRNGLMAGGIINLNRRAFLIEGDSEASRDDAYYSMLSVRMVFEDSQSLIRAWINAAKEAEQEQNRTGNSGGECLYPTTITPEVLTSIDEITTRAIGVLSSFTNELAGVDSIATKQFLEAFDSIISAINSINTVIGGCGAGYTSRTQQA